MGGYHFWVSGLILEPTLTTVPVSQFSRSVSAPLQPHGLQHTRLPCPSPTPELAQTHDHQVGDAIQPSHPLLSPSPPAFSLPQHQVLFPMSQSFASGGQNIGASASVFAVNIQVWFALGLACWISWQSKGLSRVFSNSPVQKHRFFGIQPSSWGNSYIHTWLLEKS